MNIALVTDAWAPQINGVVRTWSIVVDELRRLGHRVTTITPNGFAGLPWPGEPEIRLAITTPGAVGQRLEHARPEAIHIATEGPLGAAARRFCLQRKLAFTTSYHTHFPHYLKLRIGVPKRVTFAFIRLFHRPAQRVLVTTDTLAAELADHGFQRLTLWSRGVDARLFRPIKNLPKPGPGPVMLYVGRVALEKNIGAFLDLDVPGSKVVVGDGPQRAALQARYPEVHFAGWQQGEALARYYAAADVFVFPSRTDTYGLVLLEALAAGLPVAAYPVPGPLDVLGSAPQVACLHENLATAVRGALRLSPRAARRYALGFCWQACAEHFVELLAPVATAAWSGDPASVHGPLRSPS